MKVFDTSTLEEDTPLTKDENGMIYCGLDSTVDLEALEVMETHLDEVSRATYDFSLAKQGPVLDMTLRGCFVDEAERQRALQTFQNHSMRISHCLHKIITEGMGLPPINWKSPKQLGGLFYDIMRLPEVKKYTPAGYRRTVGADALERLCQHYYAEPLCLHILALRDLEKKIQFLSTEVDEDGCIRTSFNIAGTDTGRFSSSTSAFGTGGNLQNVDRHLRRVIRARPQKILVNIDLEQGDSRNLGAILWNIFLESHGEDFAGAYLNACESADLHVAVARMVWPTHPWAADSALWKSQAEEHKVYRTFSMRDTCKRLGHGTNFLGTAAHMAKELRLPRSNVELFQFNYLRAFPAIPEWHKWLPTQLKNFGYLKTLMGRRRFFYGRLTDNRTINKAAAYAPQGSTSDTIDAGMLQIWRKFPHIAMLQQGHDSLLFEIDRARLEDDMPAILETTRVVHHLERGRDFTIPLDAKTGWNWGEVEKDKDGNEIDNLWGMRKWKGQEKRLPPVYSPKQRLSFQSLIG